MVSKKYYVKKQNSSLGTVLSLFKIFISLSLQILSMTLARYVFCLYSRFPSFANVKSLYFVGKDAAGIAMEAIRYARDANIDVVLVDTAGRMQDNEPLMKALSKVGTVYVHFFL